MEQVLTVDSLMVVTSIMKKQNWKKVKNSEILTLVELWMSKKMQFTNISKMDLFAKVQSYLKDMCLFVNMLKFLNQLMNTSILINLLFTNLMNQVSSKKLLFQEMMKMLLSQKLN